MRNGMTPTKPGPTGGFLRALEPNRFIHSTTFPAQQEKEAPPPLIHGPPCLLGRSVGAAGEKS